MSELATASWEAIGTTALVRVEDPATLPRAREILVDELDAIDRAASRFRSDSELELVNRHAGGFTRIGPLLHQAITVALRAAAVTGGAVDPTLGQALRIAGYDRDWATLDHGDPAARPATTPSPPLPPQRPVLQITRASGWREVRLSDDPPGVVIPAGMRLDLGATAKALCADRAADRIATAVGAGALVSLGGDIAVAGPVPEGGWAIHVTDDHRSGSDAPGQTVAISTGGLATSSTTTRRWRHRERTMHHILDPATGAPAEGPWRTVSVAAATCVDANTASTAAIVLGERAVEWLRRQQLAARLVGHDGHVLTVGGWPEEPE
jgi:thiamine biosynthesis lipoprotein